MARYRHACYSFVMDADPARHVIDAAKKAVAPASRKVAAFRWYTLAVAVIVGGGKWLDVQPDLLGAAVEHLTWALGMVVGANALGDHAAGAVGRVAEAVGDVLGGAARRGRGE